ncbi:ABC transporter permease [Thalassotalea piscium]|uniref:Sodium transport system permease protein n=1 Tax=Thalassotalea piscium TaxID=1230533 RepID=A0A7X0NE58_9GAMM|nr:ABC transporter permease [Thalassotalea piscium]MBB6541788.1 sodium transport system permease protein [Thalassotalea piscium]
MIQFKALLKKELKEAFRDKRALMVAMMMAIMAPIMIFAMSKMMIKEMASTPLVYVKVTGSEFAPKLIKAFADDNIKLFSDVPAEEAELWDKRNIELTIPETFAQDMLDGKRIDIYLKADFSEKPMNAPLRRIKETIQNYAQAIGYKRLLVRGIDVNLLRPVNVIEQDTSSPSSNFIMISMMLGLYLLMAAFMSGLSVAIDSSAGERERNVLEMLLCQPVSTLKIVLAKLSCASTIAFIGVLLTISLTFASIGFVDLTKIGASFSLDLSAVVIIVVMLIPICFFASALQLFFSFQAKSFKEAQSSVTMVVLIPAMLPFIMTFIDDKPKWFDWVPVTGQSLIMEDIFKGLPVDWTNLALTTLVTIVLTAILVFTLAKKLTSEKVVQSLS